MQLRHDDFSCRDALFLVHAHRDAAAIVFDGNRAVRIKLYQNQITMTGQSFINGIVRHFEHHMVQARSVIGVTDIHSRAFAHCIQAFKDLDRICAIFALLRAVSARLWSLVAHS